MGYINRGGHFIVVWSVKTLKQKTTKTETEETSPAAAWRGRSLSVARFCCVNSSDSIQLCTLREFTQVDDKRKRCIPPVWRSSVGGWIFYTDLNLSASTERKCGHVCACFWHTWTYVEQNSGMPWMSWGTQEYKIRKFLRFHPLSNQMDPGSDTHWCSYTTNLLFVWCESDNRSECDEIFPQLCWDKCVMIVKKNNQQKLTDL